jgi:hypothetical protein
MDIIDATLELVVPGLLYQQVGHSIFAHDIAILVQLRLLSRLIMGTGIGRLTLSPVDITDAGLVRYVAVFGEPGEVVVV